MNEESGFETEGKKEIVQAVAIAALSAVAVDLLKWGLESLKETLERKKKAKEAVETSPAKVCDAI